MTNGATEEEDAEERAAAAAAASCFFVRGRLATTGAAVACPSCTQASFCPGVLSIVELSPPAETVAGSSMGEVSGSATVGWRPLFLVSFVDLRKGTLSSINGARGGDGDLALGSTESATFFLGAVMACQACSKFVSPSTFFFIEEFQ